MNCCHNSRLYIKTCQNHTLSAQKLTNVNNDAQVSTCVYRIDSLNLNTEILIDHVYPALITSLSPETMFLDTYFFSLPGKTNKLGQAGQYARV